jgi:type IV pilus assembly protein PilN
MIGSLGLAIAVGLLVHGFFAAQVSSQEQRNAFLKAENAALDKKIEEIKSLKEGIDQLKAQQAIIQQLQSDRSASTQILEQMARLAPTGVYLKGISQSGQKINVTGYAQSSELVSSLMTAVQTSPYLDKPELVEIKAANINNRRLAEFSLNFSLRKAAVAEDDASKKSGAKPAAPAVAAGALPVNPGAVAAPVTSGAAPAPVVPPALSNPTTPAARTDKGGA